jgi:hypothetical protein
VLVAQAAPARLWWVLYTRLRAPRATCALYGPVWALAFLPSLSQDPWDRRRTWPT